MQVLGQVGPESTMPPVFPHWDKEGVSFSFYVRAFCTVLGPHDPFAVLLE